MPFYYSIMTFVLGSKKFNYMIENDILQNYSPKNIGDLKGNFWGFRCPNDT